MNLKIQSILLWPRNRANKIQKIDLSLDKINVITGLSQKGKSAFIAITDYCLGSQKCSIPVGIIREKTEWFGVLLQTGNFQLLLARKEPGKQAQTSEMYMEEGPTIDISKPPEKNCNTDAAKNRLNQIAGLSTLDIDDSSSFGSRPSIRDLAAFTYQPQHIVANPYTLFFKADTYEHQEKLKNVFPLVLGAVDNRTLALKRELRDLENKFELARRTLLARQKIASSWQGEIKGYYRQADELGLLGRADQVDKDATVDNYVRILSKLTKTKFPAAPQLNQGGSDRAAMELNSLMDEEVDLSHQIGVQKQKLSKLYQLMSSATDYNQSLTIQNSRLENIDWFAEKLENSATCPFCLSDNTKAHEQIKVLKAASRSISESTASISKTKEVLDKEVADIKQILHELEERLNVVRTHKNLIEDKSEEIRAKKQTTENIHRFVGKLEQSLENLEHVQADSSLVITVSDLQEQMNNLRAQLDPGHERIRLRDALQRVSKLISFYGNILETERANDPIALDIKNLTIKISSREGREDFLWEIGSGANWMGYHIATALALHEHFLSIKDSPVPQFLFIDQPSQVYFPEGWPVDNEKSKNISKTDLVKEEDIIRVRNIFKALSMALKQTENKLQIIVIEHADEITWEGVESVHVAKRWRDEDALIPPNWVD